jgi:DNA-binding SARP family transcriptional activator/predicted ATPase
MGQLSISLLGSFQAHLDGHPLGGFAYDKVRALLAYLAVESNRPHSREKLTALFWPNQSPDAARSSLRQALATLRRAIGDQKSVTPFLLLDQGNMQMNPDASVWLDVGIFQQHLAASQNHIHTDIETCPSCIQHLETGAALYRGDFFDGLLLQDSEEFELWAVTKREEFRLQALTSFFHLTNHYMRRGQYSKAQAYAFRQVEIEPYCEEAHRQLMSILAHSGQRSAALAQYESCRRMLASELGVLPARETCALYERIRSAAENRPNNLPLPLPALIGREEEIANIAEHLSNPECRLLTLTGMGGVGKTSLVLRAAVGHLGDFLHGVFFVPLAALQSFDQVLTTLTEILHLTHDSQTDPRNRLLNYLRDKSLLLVLDNFEHLLPHDSPKTLNTDKEKTRPQTTGTNDLLQWLGEMLQTAPHLKLLVTSRERLKLQAEWVIPLEGLSYPRDPDKVPPADLPNYASIELFVSTARRVAASFNPSEDDYRHIARICRLNDGVPLGVQLAAGWTESLSCATIAAEIQSDLDFLATSLRDVPDRHHSLSTVFDHSHRLLSTAEQAVLCKLSVFHGPFQRAAARDVAGAGNHHLTALVNKSFLRAGPGGRYDLHPLLKMFLRQKLAATPQEQTAAEARHAAYYAGFMQSREDALVVQQDNVALNEVGMVFDDVSAAWNWAAAHHDLDLLSKSLESLNIFCWARNRFQEGREAFERALGAIASHDSASPQNQLLLERLRCHEAEFTAWLGDLPAARSQLQSVIDSLRRLSTDKELIDALNLMGMINYWQGDFSLARDVLQEALSLARDRQNRHNLAHALVNLANTICDETADYETATPLYAESLALYRELNNLNGVAKALVNQGAMYHETGDFPQAKLLYEQSLEIYRQVDYPPGISAAINNLAQVERSLGNLTKARELLLESLALKRTSGNPNGIIHSLLEIGIVDTAAEMYAEAHDNFHEAILLAREAGASSLMLHILVGQAELYMKQGNMQSAAVLAAFVISQKEPGLELINQINDLLGNLKQVVPEKVLNQYKERAKSRTLEEVVSEVLTEGLHLHRVDSGLP